MKGLKKIIVAELNKACFESKTTEPPDDSLFLTTKNDKADQYNDKKLDEMIASGKQLVVYRAEINNMPKDKIERIPAPKELRLCEGAKVMVTRNIYDKKHRLSLVNGDTGTVVELKESSVVIRVKDHKTHKERFEELFPQKWENFSYVWDEKKNTIGTEINGTFSQIPLRLGWAITIHKSQGMTLDSIVVDANNAFAPGQVYVALSRCKTLEGIYLKEPLNCESIFADPQVQQFCKIISENC